MHHTHNIVNVDMAYNKKPVPEQIADRLTKNVDIISKTCYFRTRIVMRFMDLNPLLPWAEAWSAGLDLILI